MTDVNLAGGCDLFATLDCAVFQDSSLAHAGTPAIAHKPPDRPMAISKLDHSLGFRVTPRMP